LRVQPNAMMLSYCHQRTTFTWDAIILGHIVKQIDLYEANEFSTSKTQYRHTLYVPDHSHCPGAAQSSHLVISKVIDSLEFLIYTALSGYDPSLY
jgi:hypothetical protein